MFRSDLRPEHNSSRKKKPRILLRKPQSSRQLLCDSETARKSFLQGLKPIGCELFAPGLKPRPPKEREFFRELWPSQGYLRDGLQILDAVVGVKEAETGYRDKWWIWLAEGGRRRRWAVCRLLKKRSLPEG
jgi:hypothetical protein